MTLPQYIAISLLALICAGTLAAIFGAFIKEGGKDCEHFEQLDAEHVQREVAKLEREDGWTAELEYLIVEQTFNLATLRAMPATLENLDARGCAVISIGVAERTLATLKARRPNDRRESAATFLEGRM